MSKTLTKTANPAWTLPALPTSLRFTVGMGVPLLATVWVLQSRLVALPEGAWAWEIDPSFLLLVHTPGSESDSEESIHGAQEDVPAVPHT